MQDYFHGEEEEVGLIVRGGLYEADLKQRRLKACYWPEPSHRILRGTWFVEKSPDWVPLKVRDKTSEQFVKNRKGVCNELLKWSIYRNMTPRLAP